MDRLAALSIVTHSPCSFLLKKGIKLAQHGAAIADESGIGLPVPVDFMRVDINPHYLGCGRNDVARLEQPVEGEALQQQSHPPRQRSP